MPKVTQVEPQKKTLRLRSGRNPHRFNVYLDGKFAFGADEDTVVNFRLVPGKEIQQDQLQKILFETEVGKLIDRVYGLLAVRARSESEIRQYLKRLNFKRKIKDKEELPDVVVESLIDKLKQKNLLNDLEFAKAWVEGRRKSKQKGQMALKAELFQKGISREIIEEVLSEPSNIGDKDLAFQALEKKAKSFEGLDEVEFKKKALGFLGRKGFNYEVVSGAIAKFLKKE